MAVSKRTKKKPSQRVPQFPKAKGKIIAEVEFSLSPDYNVIEIVFQDKTSLTFNLESCLQVAPELVSWKSGSYKPIKRWRSVHSVNLTRRDGGFFVALLWRTVPSKHNKILICCTPSRAYFHGKYRTPPGFFICAWTSAQSSAFYVAAIFYLLILS